MAVDNETRTSRRRVLAAAIGGAGALAVSRLAGPAATRAADTDPALMGTANVSTTETGFQNTDAGETSVHVVQTTGIGVQVETTTGTGIRAAASDSTPSDFVDGSYRSGVVATVGDLGTPGLVDSIVGSSDESAVYGYSNVSGFANGVWGDSWDGTGVYGTGASGVYGAGFNGVTGIGSNVGLYGVAGGPTAYALYTSGKIKFSGRSGRTSITSGHQYKDVTISGMTTASAVIVTLSTYKSGYSVAAAVSYAGKFRMYLNKSATSTIYFSYLVIG
jgi:hypothetical protein